MSKKTFVAVDPGGHVHTRMSNLVYTHSVVYRVNYAREIEYLGSRSHKNSLRPLYKHWKSIAEGHSPYPRNDFSEPVTDAVLKVVAIAVAAIDGCETFDHFVANAKATALSNIKRLIVEGYYDAYHNAGWCKSEVLAQQLAHRRRRKGHLDVTIVEASEA